MRPVVGPLRLSLRGRSENPNISKHSGRPDQEDQTSSAESVGVCTRTLSNLRDSALYLSCHRCLSSDVLAP
jgi:hypothetical protein